MPATRATASTSPLVIAPEAIFAAVSASMCTRHRATARRWVASLAVTSTMRARPSGSRWVNSEADMAGSLRSPPVGICSRLPADLAHRPVGADEVDLPDAVPGPLGADRPVDLGGEPVVERVVVGATCAAIARRSNSSSANRQVRSLPSAVIRIRSHCSQNGSVTLAITPTSPMPSAYAEALGRLDVLAVVGARHREALEREHRVDALEDLVRGHDLVAAPLRRRRRGA